MFITGRMSQSGKLPILNLLTGQKSGFPRFSQVFPTRCTDSGQTWQRRRARGSAWLRKISPQSPQGGGNAAPKYQKFPLFGKESPSGATPLTDFEFYASFIRSNIVHQWFKFDLIRFTGY